MDFLHILYHNVLPYVIALGSFVLVIQLIEKAYMKKNGDKTVQKIISTIIIVAIFSLVFVLGHWIMSMPAGAWAATFLHNTGAMLSKTPIVGFLVSGFIKLKNAIVVLCSQYFISYFNAFLLVYFFGAMIALAGLKWRIDFYKSLNVIASVVIRFPLLVFQYFSGYETPVKDKILQGVLQAKIRENLNNSYDRATDNLDDRGKKFKDGAEETAANQSKKATTVALRHAVVTIKTAAGQRKAHILVKQSRKTETDRSIENLLKGLGSRISGDSIYFPADPTYSQAEKGYVFDSIVSYNPAKELGSFKKLFNNPFAQQNKVSLGGKGSFQVFINTLKDFGSYLRHLTPIAIYDRIIESSSERDKQKITGFKSNLDLSIIPVPRDSKTGNTVEEQRKLSLQKANDRIADVKIALNSLKLTGQFLDVKVGGSVAIYRFALPPDPKLPSDFDKVQEQLANMLHIQEVPIITLKAGILEVSINNGINIPVSFVDMVKKNKPSKNIIHGMLGMDAMNEPIYFDLGDKVPHASFYGKTGTGKTVTIFTVLYSVMSQTDPKHLRIAYCDGKGNSFEFMKLDGNTPNPFTYAPPADASGDIDYARALIAHMEQECRRRIDLFKHEAVAKLSEYNEKHPDDPLPEILFVCDEFSAITQQDKNLKASEMVKKGTVDKFEYIAKMARSVGIRMILANQSARKELVPGKISANLPGHVSLGVTEPIEAEIALPETGIKLNLISQPGEFYSTMNGSAHPEHGNSPYIPQKIAEKLNVKLTEKFGKATYVKTREQIMEETEFTEKKKDESNSPFNSRSNSRTKHLSQKDISRNENRSLSKEQSVTKVIEPDKPLTKETSLSEICKYAKQDGGKYIPYIEKNIGIVDENVELHSINENTKKNAQVMAAGIKKEIDRFNRIQKDAHNGNSTLHKSTGDGLVRDVTGGKDGEVI